MSFLSTCFVLFWLCEFENGLSARELQEAGKMSCVINVNKEKSVFLVHLNDPLNIKI